MSAHVVSPKVYFAIYAALMVGTAATVLAATVDMGRLNTVVALTIAVTKAMLVILYFMHVRYSSRLTWLVISAGFAWLGILIGFTLSDVLTRGWLG
jgi:cytochrome c oxidase subunit IV